MTQKKFKMLPPLSKNKTKERQRQKREKNSSSHIPNTKKKIKKKSSSKPSNWWRKLGELRFLGDWSKNQGKI